jgi:hypothetical protein
MSDFPPAMPHHALVPIFEDAWYLKGSVNFKPLVRLQRNMVVLRHDGELMLINSIRLNEAGEAALEALGTIAHVVKIGGHGMDDAYYADRFGAKRWGLPGVAESMGAQTLTADSLPRPGLSLFSFELTKAPEGALLLETDGGLLITCDSVQHWEPSDLMSLAAKMVTGVMGFKHPAQIGPPWRKKMTPEGGTLKPDFLRMAALPFTRQIGGHGGLCDENAAALLSATITRVYPA